MLQGFEFRLQGLRFRLQGLGASSPHLNPKPSTLLAKPLTLNPKWPAKARLYHEGTLKRCTALDLLTALWLRHVLQFRAQDCGSW